MKSAGVIRYLSKLAASYVMNERTCKQCQQSELFSEQSELDPTSSKVILISLSIFVCGNEKSVLVSANIYVTIT